MHTVGSYTLTAAPTNTGTGIAGSGASSSFNITAGVASKLAFIQQPSNTVPA